MAKRKTIKTKQRRQLRLALAFLMLSIITVVSIVLYLNTDFFRTKRSSFIKYLSQVSSCLDVLDDEDLQSYISKKESTPYVREGSATIQSSSNVAESSIMDKIKFTVKSKVDNENDKMHAEVSAYKNSELLAGATIVREKDIYGFHSPQVSNGYIAVRNKDLKTLLKNIESDLNLPDEIKSLNLEKIEETSKEENKKLEECLEVLNDSELDNAYNKEVGLSLELDGTKYDTTRYTLELNKEQSANMQIKLLKKISTDSILMNYFTSKCILLNLDKEYCDLNKLNEHMKARINTLEQNPSEAEAIKIVIYENGQKNVRTEVIYGTHKYVIDHIKNNDLEKTIVTIDDTIVKVQKEKENWNFKYENTSGVEDVIDITWHQEGTLSDNNIKNIITLTKQNGIKKVTYSYQDTINFTDEDITVEGFGGSQRAIINDYDEDDVKDFVDSIKEAINNVYVSAGTKIGINLDRIFN